MESHYLYLNNNEPLPIITKSINICVITNYSTIDVFKNLPTSIVELRLRTISCLADCLAVCQLPNLKIISIQDEIFTEIPSVSHFSQLEKIIIISSSLKSLPTHLIDCHYLKEIDLLQANKIDWEQAFSILKKIPSLYSLAINHHIKNIKLLNQISELQQIKELSLTYDLQNRFSWEVYIDIIKKMPHLEVFKSYYKGNEIPSSIQEIGHLKEFHLCGYGNNKLKLPIEIINLPNTFSFVHPILEKINPIIHHQNLSIEQKKELFTIEFSLS